MSFAPFVLLKFELTTSCTSQVRRDSFWSLRSLRLVSREFNALVEPLAFSSVTLFRYNLQPSEFHSQLSWLASGKSVNSRCTTRLRIFEYTFPPVERPPPNPFPSIREQKRPEELEDIRVSALGAQRNHMVAAIGALVHVTHVMCVLPTLSV